MQEKKDKNNRIVNGYIGTYFSENSKGIYRFAFDEESGELTAPELFYESRDAKWVSVGPDRICFPMEENGRAGTCFLEREKGQIKHVWKILEEAHTPCYLQQDGDYVYTANYHDGTVMVYHLSRHVPEIRKRIENGEKAGCHQILLHGPWLLVPCLEQNRIRIFDRENGFGPAGEIPFPEGSGPRHGVFDRAHKRLYVVSEWSNTLFTFAADGKEFRLIQSLPLLLRKENAAAAAIRISPGEEALYISVRGPDILIRVDIRGDKAVLEEYVSSRGVHPRDFILTDDGRFVLVANRQEGGLVSLERNRESGKIVGIRSRIPIPEAVSVVLDKPGIPQES